MAAIVFRENIFVVNEVLHLCTNQSYREVVRIDDGQTILNVASCGQQMVKLRERL